MSGGKLDRFLCLPGSRGRADPAWNILVGGGHVPRIWRLFVPQPHFAISLPGSHLAVVDRPASAAPAGTSGTDSDPPFFAAGIGTQWGGFVPGHVPYPVPPLWGSLSSNLSLREGFGQDPEHKPPRRARNAPEASLMKWRVSGPHLWRALLLRLGFHLAAFPLPGDDPMLDLVLYHTPNFYAWVGC